MLTPLFNQHRRLGLRFLHLLVSVQATLVRNMGTPYPNPSMGTSRSVAKLRKVKTIRLRTTTSPYQTAFRHFGSSIGFTTTEIEPSAFTGCSQAQARGFSTPGLSSISADKCTAPTYPAGSRN